jgi:hypothetical protein
VRRLVSGRYALVADTYDRCDMSTRGQVRGMVFYAPRLKPGRI